MFTAFMIISLSDLVSPGDERKSSQAMNDFAVVVIGGKSKGSTESMGYQLIHELPYGKLASPDNQAHIKICDSVATELQI
jgi:hypothetical protein